MNVLQKLYYLTSLLSIMLLSLPCAKAMMGGRSSDDPLFHLNYRRAFDQTIIHIKHQSLMGQLGCAENTQPTHTINDVEAPSEQQRYTPPPPTAFNQILDNFPPVEISIISNTFESSPEWEKYKNNCISHLQKARHAAILEPARQAGTTICLLAGMSAGVISFLGLHSFGGNIIISASFFNSVFLVKEITSSLYYRYSTPTHPLDELEERFAVNQCFIPKDLWPAIITNFMTARQNPFAQQNSIAFIEFTLGLITYYPKPSITLYGDYRGVVNKFSSTLDTFFEDYTDFASKEEYGTLKTNILKFVLSLFGEDSLSRYIYLQGQGGIGKTYFTKRLCEQLNAITNNSVHVEENLIITTSDELEGTEKKPGAFLRVLRNQSAAKKIGSIVFMDEASWLNQENMISPSKRVFNGLLSQISSTYFGAGLDGTGIHLNTPPMLIILAGNSPIIDEPLKSRFDTINFPLPKKETLITYGETLFRAHASKLVRSNSLSTAETIVTQLQNCETFRDVEAAVSASIGKEYFPLRRRGTTVNTI